jgi:murein DD-endopeptidase MepM/ murein hydrolase activator NlpD
VNKRLSYFFVAVLIIVSVAPASASQITQKASQKSSIDSQISDLNQKKEEIKQKKNQINGVKQDKESQIADQERKLSDLKAKSDFVNNDIAEADQVLSAASADYNAKVDLLKKRIVAMYVNSNYSYIDALLDSENVDRFMGKVEYMSLIAQNDKELIETCKKAKEDISIKKQVLVDKAKRLEDVTASKKMVMNNLLVSRSQLDDQLNKVNQDLNEIMKIEDALEAQSKQIAEEIKRLQRNGRRTYVGGSMVWPVPSSSYISSPYGYRIHPITHTRKFHSGIDIAASYGVSIEAANSGTVIYAGWNGGYGNTVIIDHGAGVSTLYAHTSRILVSVGESVKGGEVIAKVGSTGLSTGPHLHFEVRKNGETTNPLNYVGR